VTYTLTVQNGTGGGNYESGTQVTITANAPPSGEVFDKWEIVTGGGSLADANSTSTKYTMPSNASTVKAKYKTAPSVTYTLTVQNGTGGGNYESGTQVTVTANAPPNGEVFDKWEIVSGGGSFADASSASTKYTMPPNAATIRAKYKTAPVVTYALTVQNGTGGGNYESGTQVTVTANAPPNGEVFDKWEIVSGGGSFADANSASTKYTMPPNAATIRAKYKTDIPDGVEEVANEKLLIRGVGKVLYIDSSHSGTVHVYSVSGICVQVIQYSAGENTITVNIPSGMYIVVEEQGNKIFKVRIR
jgi:hypothetical protein